MIKLPNTPFRRVQAIEHGERKVTRGVVLHTIEGSDEGAVSWFANPEAGGVGAHVVVGYNPPQRWQLTDLNTLCYHAVSANSSYIGIEHEGRASDSRLTWVKRRTQRKMSANAVAWICYHYALGKPVKGRNVFGHVDFPAGGHHDPGPGFWAGGLYMAACRRAYRNLARTHGRKWSAS